MPLGKNPAERLALKLRSRCVRALNASTDLEVPSEVIPGDPFVEIGIVFVSRDVGDYKNYSFDIAERIAIWDPIDQRMRRGSLEWQVEITVTPELDVIAEKLVGDVPIDLIKHALEYA